MASTSLACLWEANLRQAGWSRKAIKRAEPALAASTRRSYDNMLMKCRVFAQENGIVFPPSATHEVAELICFLAENSTRPQSCVNIFLAAIKQVFRASDMKDITDNFAIKRLVTAVTKSQTERPMKRSAVLPVGQLLDTIKLWGVNSSMPIKFLRIKTISLLAISLMLRPSDIAPNATFFEGDSLEEQKIVFSTDMVVFKESIMEVTLFGTKNDLDRKGFVVTLPAHSDVTVCPIASLKCYIERTSHLRRGNAVFLSLKAPYGPLSSASVAKDLQACLDMAGLKNSGFSAKSFRPTGATVAIEKGNDPKTVQSVGRWKSSEVFYNHYVHSRTPESFTSAVLS